MSDGGRVSKPEFMIVRTGSGYEARDAKKVSYLGRLWIKLTGGDYSTTPLKTEQMANALFKRSTKLSGGEFDSFEMALAKAGINIKEGSGNAVKKTLDLARKQQISALMDRFKEDENPGATFNKLVALLYAAPTEVQEELVDKVLELSKGTFKVPSESDANALKAGFSILHLVHIQTFSAKISKSTKVPDVLAHLLEIKKNIQITKEERTSLENKVFEKLLKLWDAQTDIDKQLNFARECFVPLRDYTGKNYKFTEGSKELRDLFGSQIKYLYEKVSSNRTDLPWNLMPVTDDQKISKYEKKLLEIEDAKGNDEQKTRVDLIKTWSDRIGNLKEVRQTYARGFELDQITIGDKTIGNWEIVFPDSSELKELEKVALFADKIYQYLLDQNVNESDAVKLTTSVLESSVNGQLKQLDGLGECFNLTGFVSSEKGLKGLPLTIGPDLTGLASATIKYDKDKGVLTLSSSSTVQKQIDNGKAEVTLGKFEVHCTKENVRQIWSPTIKSMAQELLTRAKEGAQSKNPLSELGIEHFETEIKKALEKNTKITETLNQEIIEILDQARIFVRLNSLKTSEEPGKTFNDLVLLIDKVPEKMQEQFKIPLLESILSGYTFRGDEDEKAYQVGLSVLQKTYIDLGDKWPFQAKNSFDLTTVLKRVDLLSIDGISEEAKVAIEKMIFEDILKLWNAIEEASSSEKSDLPNITQHVDFVRNFQKTISELKVKTLGFSWTKHSQEMREQLGLGVQKFIKQVDGDKTVVQWDLIVGSNVRKTMSDNLQKTTDEEVQNRVALVNKWDQEILDINIVWETYQRIDLNEIKIGENNVVFKAVFTTDGQDEGLEKVAVLAEELSTYLKTQNPEMTDEIVKKLVVNALQAGSVGQIKQLDAVNDCVCFVREMNEKIDLSNKLTTAGGEMKQTRSFTYLDGILTVNGKVPAVRALNREEVAGGELEAKCAEDGTVQQIWTPDVRKIL